MLTTNLTVDPERLFDLSMMGQHQLIHNRTQWPAGSTLLLSNRIVDGLPYGTVALLHNPHFISIEIECPSPQEMLMAAEGMLRGVQQHEATRSCC